MDTKRMWRRTRAVWGRQNIVVRLVVVNAAIFVLMRVAVIVGMFAGRQWQPEILSWLEMPGEPMQLLTHPWTLLTYMFTQYDVMHLVFNMLWFYWFATIFMSIATTRRIVGLYLLGGLAGAAAFVVSWGMWHPGSTLVGSSASVIAIVTATAILMPHFRLQLLLIGPVSLKWLAIITIGIDLLSLGGTNVGGHIAHLGGAALGALFALLLKRGTDITALPRRRKRPPRRAPSRPKSDIDNLDEILDKIRKSGYKALTAEEKRRLFETGSRLK